MYRAISISPEHPDPVTIIIWLEEQVLRNLFSAWMPVNGLCLPKSVSKNNMLFEGSRSWMCAMTNGESGEVESPDGDVCENQKSHRNNAMVVRGLEQTNVRPRQWLEYRVVNSEMACALPKNAINLSRSSLMQRVCQCHESNLTFLFSPTSSSTTTKTHLESSNEKCCS